MIVEAWAMVSPERGGSGPKAHAIVINAVSVETPVQSRAVAAVCERLSAARGGPNIVDPSSKPCLGERAGLVQVCRVQQCDCLPRQSAREIAQGPDGQIRQGGEAGSYLAERQRLRRKGNRRTANGLEEVGARDQPTRAQPLLPTYERLLGPLLGPGRDVRRHAARSRGHSDRKSAPYPFCLNNRPFSRSQSLFFSVSRLSCSFLPLASASSTLARPFSLK
jgi:hypothetical protein